MPGGALLTGAQVGTNVLNMRSVWYLRYLLGGPRQREDSAMTSAREMIARALIGDSDPPVSR